MRRPTVLLPLLLVLAGCGSAPGGPAGGRLTIVRAGRGGRTLVSAPAVGAWCASDSSLAVLAVTSSGSGGVAVRAAWPLPSPDSFTVQPRLAGLGTATAAWRNVGDTVSVAFAADSGLVVLRAGASVSGRFTAWATLFDTAVVRLEGTLDAIPVRHDCGGPAK